MLRSAQADKSAERAANKGVAKNVNNKSDEYLTKQFYQEFCEVIKDQLEIGGNNQGESESNGQQMR